MSQEKTGGNFDRRQSLPYTKIKYLIVILVTVQNLY